MDGSAQCGFAYCALRRKLALQRLLDQPPRIVYAVELDEAAEARASLLAQEHLIDGAEPGVGHAGLVGRRTLGARILVARDRTPDIVEDGLQRLGAGVGRRLAERIRQCPQSAGLHLVGTAELLVRRHE